MRAIVVFVAVPFRPTLRSVRGSLRGSVRVFVPRESREHRLAVGDGESDASVALLHVVLHHDVAYGDPSDERPRASVIHHPHAERPRDFPVYEEVVCGGKRERRAPLERDGERREEILERVERRRGRRAAGRAVAHVLRVRRVRPLDARQPTRDLLVQPRDERPKHRGGNVRERGAAVEHRAVPLGERRGGRHLRVAEDPSFGRDDVIRRVSRVGFERRVRERGDGVRVRRKASEGDRAAAFEGSVAQRKRAVSRARRRQLYREGILAVAESHETVSLLLVNAPALARRASEHDLDVAEVAAEVDDVLHQSAAHAGTLGVVASVRARVGAGGRVASAGVAVGGVASDRGARGGRVGVEGVRARVRAARGAAIHARDVGEGAAGVDDELEPARGGAQIHVRVVVAVLLHGTVQGGGGVGVVRGGGGGVVVAEESAAAVVVGGARARGVEGPAEGAKGVGAMPARRTVGDVDVEGRRRRVRGDRERQERRGKREEDATTIHRPGAVRSREARRRPPVAVCRALPPNRSV